MKWRVIAVALLLAVLANGQSARYGCDPPPEVAAGLSEVEILRAGNLAPDQFRTRTRAITSVLVREFPNDVFANLRHLSLYREKGHDELIAAYRKAMEAHPEDERSALFYAASLIGTDTPEALRRLGGLARPEFPYAYLLIGQIHSFQKFRDKSTASLNLLQFVRACPTYFPAYELLAYFGSGDELKTAAARLRTLLKGRSDLLAILTHQWLWAMEFRVAPPAEHPDLRARIASDLASWGEIEHPALVETLREGYRLSGNQQALDALPPRSSKPAIYEASAKWAKENPFPKAEAAPEERRRYWQSSAEAAQSWISKWPSEPMGYHQRFAALSKLTEVSEQDLVVAGEQLIVMNRKRPGVFMRIPSVIEVAQAYVDRGIRLNEVPAMIEAGLREAETTRAAPESDLIDDRNFRLNEESRFQARIQARGVLFELAMKSSKNEQAHQSLQRMREDLNSLFAVATQTGFAQFYEAGYWTKMARLAERENRIQDAAEYQRTAQNIRRTPFRADTMPAPVKVAGRKLPPFRATGLDGRVWADAELEGKIVVMNVWATWCGPCVEELPLVQKLYDTLKDRKDVVTLSLNIDAYPGIVELFLKGRGFNFPVLLAHSYVNSVLQDISIPRTWIVESGVVRFEDVGMDNGSWVKWVLAKVEETLERR